MTGLQYGIALLIAVALSFGCAASHTPSVVKTEIVKCPPTKPLALVITTNESPPVVETILDLAIAFNDVSYDLGQCVETVTNWDRGWDQCGK